jgi:hypothetical protein
MPSLDAARGASESSSPKEEGKDKPGPPASSGTSQLKRGRGEADNDNAPPEQKQRSESGIARNINANAPDNMGAEGGYNDVYKVNQEARQTTHSGSAAALMQEDNAMGAANLATSRMPVGPGVSSFQANFPPGTMQQHLFMNAAGMPTAGGQQMIPASLQQAHPQTASQHHLQNYVLEPANQQNVLGMQQGKKGGEQQDEGIPGNSDGEKKSRKHPPSHQPDAGGAVPVDGEGAHVLPATMTQGTGGQKTAGGPIGTNIAQIHPNAAQFVPQMFPQFPPMMRPFFVAGHVGMQRFVGQPPVAPRTDGISLALSCDNEQLSEYQIYVRKQLEIFAALQEDVESNTQGRKKQVVLGQVGIRCRHCAGFPMRQRGRGSIYYPTKLQGKWKGLSGVVGCV